jgi:hypothetical protein
MGGVGVLTSLLGDPPGLTAQRFAVELHGGGSGDVLAAAEESGAFVVEIREAP